MKISEVIQAFLLATYSVGNDLTFLKQRGFYDFPITNMGNLSVPDMFAQTRAVNLSLLSPMTFYIFKLKCFIRQQMKK